MSPPAGSRRSCSLAGRGWAIALALLLGGCATFSERGGADQVESLARERVGKDVLLPLPREGNQADWRAETERLLAQPLSADTAVRVALLNNPRVKVSLASLGIAEADLVQAGRLVNPVFSFSNKRNSEAQSVERTVLLNVMALVTMPLRTEVATRQFEATQLEVAGDVIALANDVRKAWIAAVAAQESVKYFGQVKEAAEAGAELAERMAKIGNFNRLSYMREQAFYADATSQLARARLAAFNDRERLARLLGVGSGARLVLPERLPELPQAPVEPAAAERVALEQRIDMLQVRQSTAALAADLGLTRATRFVNVLEAGYVNESESGERRKNGYEIEVAIPLFDWGDAKLARAEAVYMQNVHRAAEVALNAQSEVRTAYASYRSAFDIARHYRDEIVPLRKRIAEENVLRYNGMLIGVFELLADSREQIASVNGYLDALRDYWLAQADLDFALTGGSPSPSTRARAPAMQAGGPAGH